jgi:hypothetical protein
MKIVERTATKLHLQDSLGKREIAKILTLICMLLIVSIIVCFEPTKTQLNCRKSPVSTNCQITTWNALNLYSQTKKVQLTDVQLKERRKAYPILLLQTDQGIIRSPSSEKAYSEEQKIRFFLMQSQPTNLQMGLTISRGGYLSLICMSIIWVAMWGQLLMVPFTADWRFELDESELDDDRQNPSGKIIGVRQGLLWKHNISREFSEVLGLDVTKDGRNPKNPYYAILSMYPGRDLRLSISGLSKLQWQEINHALSEILQIPPHQTLQEQLKPWFRIFRNLDRTIRDRASK